MPNTVPVHYRLRLVPDLAQFTFEGRVEIRLMLSEPAGEIVLNAVELAVWSCELRTGDRRVPCAFRVDPGREELGIRIPEPVAGEIVLEIDYRGRINDRMAGFYRSRYRRKGRERYAAVTQFQESDARRAFPCMDHPALKAEFEIEMEVPRGLTAVSNTAIRTEAVLKAGRKRVVFEPTPRMSTYLVFFGVGEFEALTDEVDPRVRVLTLPGSQPYADFGLEFGRKALQFSEDYYALPYPLSKMDLIAVPEFAFGAMENWGAITFRENLLLRYPGITSRSGEERICEVIAHEIAHQWFGNLVTPSDWKYLWLNESFATYFGFGVVAHYHPEWGIWDQFLNGTTATALVRDAMLENYPIEIPGGEHLVINTSTAPIIYNKGGSLLRQIEGYIGAANFRQGLQRYLKAYAYQSAESTHLWEAFEAASDRPVNAMVKNWVEQPGFPLITARRAGDTVVLTQERFTFLPNPSDQRWLIPVTLRVFEPGGEPRTMTLLMDATEGEVRVGADAAYKLNDAQTGFYRVKYADPGDLRKLGEMISSRVLPPEDRWGVQNDLYALAVRGDVPLDDYFGFLKHYRAEEAYLPLASIAANLSHAHFAAGPTTRGRIEELARPLYEQALRRIGFEPQAGEAQTTSILRDQLLFEAVQYGSRELESFALGRFADLVAGRPVHPDILRSVLQTAARCGDRRTFSRLERRFRTSESEHERMTILSALGCFRGRPEIEAVLEYILTSVPLRNRFIPVVAFAANEDAAAPLWDWYVGQLPRIEAFHPMLYERVVAAVIPAAGLEQPDAVRAFFADYGRRTEKARDVIRLSLERLEINLRLRGRSR
jgi:tricorn protease interacting factor F2/3